MARTISISAQNFEDIISNDYFYVDKTGFIKEWWESGDFFVVCGGEGRYL